MLEFCSFEGKSTSLYQGEGPCLLAIDKCDGKNVAPLCSVPPTLNVYISIALAQESAVLRGSPHWFRHPSDYAGQLGGLDQPQKPRTLRKA